MTKSFGKLTSRHEKSSSDFVFSPPQSEQKPTSVTSRLFQRHSTRSAINYGPPLSSCDPKDDTIQSNTIDSLLQMFNNLPSAVPKERCGSTLKSGCKISGGKKTLQNYFSQANFLQPSLGRDLAEEYQSRKSMKSALKESKGLSSYLSTNTGQKKKDQSATSSRLSHPNGKGSIKENCLSRRLSEITSARGTALPVDNKRRETVGARDSGKSHLYQLFKEQINRQLELKDQEKVKKDLKQHFDIFLTSQIQTQNICMQSDHSQNMYGSFAASPNTMDGISKGLASVKSNGNISSLSKERMEVIKQQFAIQPSSQNSALSPTPKFSFNSECQQFSSLNSINSQKRFSLMSQKMGNTLFEYSNNKRLSGNNPTFDISPLYTATGMQSNRKKALKSSRNSSRSQRSEDKKSSHKSTKLLILKASPSSASHEKENPLHVGFKSDSIKVSNIRPKDKLLFSIPQQCYQTQSDDQRNVAFTDRDDREMALSERVNSCERLQYDQYYFSQPPSTTSTKNLLRTASAGLYMSNGKTFLKGQRYQQGPNTTIADSRSSKKDLQVKKYFAKLLVRMIVKHNQKQASEFISNLKTHKQHFASLEQRKVHLLVRSLESIILRRGIRMWKKNIVAITFMRKGFAIEKCMHLISRAIYLQPFILILQSGTSLIEKQQILEKRYRDNLQALAFDYWVKSFKLAELKRRRSNVFGRTLVQVCQKNILKGTFQRLNEKNLNLKQLQWKSLNLNISFLLSKMLATSKESLQRMTRDKIIRVLAVQNFSTTLRKIVQRKERESFVEMKENYIALKINDQVMDASKVQQVAMKELEIKLAQRKKAVFRLAMSDLERKFKGMVTDRKRDSFRSFKAISSAKRVIENLLKNYAKSEEFSCLSEAFTQWRSQTKELDERGALIDAIQGVIAEKNFKRRVHASVQKWKKFTFHQREMEKLQKSAISKWLSRKSNFLTQLRSAFSQWKLFKTRAAQLSRVSRSLQRKQLIIGFQELQLLRQASITSQRTRLPYLIYSKMIQRDCVMMNVSFQNMKKLVEARQIGQKQSKSLVACTNLAKSLSRLVQKNKQSFMQLIKQNFNTIKSKEDHFDRVMINFGDTLQDILSQRYHKSMQMIKQHSMLKSHQRQTVMRLLANKRHSTLSMTFKLWERRSYAMENQHTIATFIQNKKVDALYRLGRHHQLRLKASAFILLKECNQAFRETQKLNMAMKKFSATARLVSVLQKTSKVKQSFDQWLKACQSSEQVFLGLNILNNLSKKKLLISFRTIKNRSDKRQALLKSNQLKVKILSNLFTRIKNQKLSQIFNKLKTNHLGAKNEQERVILKGKKEKIHSQIVLLSEKDQKIRKQEAFLQMKEQQLLEQEKELRDKIRQVAKISKQSKESSHHKQVSKSPSGKNAHQFNAKSTPKQKASNPKVSQVQVEKSSVIMHTNSEIQLSQASHLSSYGPSIAQSDFTCLDDFDERKQNVAGMVTRQSHTMEGKSSIQVANQSSCQNIGKENSSSKVKSIGIRKGSYLSQSSAVNYMSSQSQASLQSEKGGILALNMPLQKKAHMMVQSSMESMQHKLLRVAGTQLCDKLSSIYKDRTIHAFKMMKVQIKRDKHRQGAQILTEWSSRKILSQCLIQWLKAVFSEEIMMQESIELMRERKLLRAILIVEKSHRKDEVMLMRAFKEWKRMEYQMVLEGLKKYSATLEKANSGGGILDFFSMKRTKR